MNNEWFNLSSGCQRTAQRDYFLGMVVTFIGLDSGRIGERPALGRSGWVTDRDRQRQKERDKETERNTEKCREPWQRWICTPQWTAALQSSIEWELWYHDLDWSSREKSSTARNPPTLSHTKATKTHKILEEGQEDFCFDISLCHILNLIIKTKNIQPIDNCFPHAQINCV